MVFIFLKPIIQNWCFLTVVLEKTLESTLDCKEIKPVNTKINQPYIFIGTTGAEAEAPVFWPPDVKSLLIGKDPDAENAWRQEKEGTAEDEMVGWHHWLSGHEFEQAPRDWEGQGSLVSCSPLGHKESDTTEWLNNNNNQVNNSLLPSPAPGTNEATFCLYEINYPCCISEMDQYLPFFVWLVLLSVMTSRFIHVVVFIIILFPFKGE